MSKLMYNGQEYSSGVNYASALPMSPSDSTKVDEAISSKADITAFVELYDSADTYAVGDYCAHHGRFYKCNTANTTGTWDSTKWDEVTLNGEMIKLASSGNTTVSGAIRGMYFEKTLLKTVSSTTTDLSINISGYQAIFVELTYWSSPAATSFFFPKSGTAEIFRVATSIDALNNFASIQVKTNTTQQVTQLNIIVNMGSATGINLYGINFNKLPS